MRIEINIEINSGKNTVFTLDTFKKSYLQFARNIGIPINL